MTSLFTPFSIILSVSTLLQLLSWWCLVLVQHLINTHRAGGSIGKRAQLHLFAANLIHFTTQWQRYWGMSFLNQFNYRSNLTWWRRNQSHRFTTKPAAHICGILGRPGFNLKAQPRRKSQNFKVLATRTIAVSFCFWSFSKPCWFHLSHRHNMFEPLFKQQSRETDVRFSASGHEASTSQFWGKMNQVLKT